MWVHDISFTVFNKHAPLLDHDKWKLQANKCKENWIHSLKLNPILFLGGVQTVMNSMHFPSTNIGQQILHLNTVWYKWQYLMSFNITWKYRTFTARWVGMVYGVEKCLESITSRWGSRNSVAEDSSLLWYYTVSYPRRLESLEEFLSDWWTGPACVDPQLYNLWPKFIHINLHA